MKDSQFYLLFLNELQDIYWTEKQLALYLPKMQKAATSVNLAKAIKQLCIETEEQVLRLEEIFELLLEKPEAIKCEAVECLLEKARSIIDNTLSDSMVRDAGIIIACQKIGHYEIAAYGSLIALSKKIKYQETVKRLKESLAEEKKSDEVFTELAASEINDLAVEE